MKSWEEILKEIVLKGVDLAEKTGEFAIEQAPDLLQQFYRWHIVGNSFTAILGIALIIFFRYAPNMWLSKEKVLDRWGNTHKFFNRYGTDSKTSVSGVLFVIASIGGSITTMISLYKLLYILVAPKLYLIEYFIR